MSSVEFGTRKIFPPVQFNETTLSSTLNFWHADSNGVFCEIYERAQGTHQMYSDVDLLIDCQSLSAHLIVEILEEIEESSFPYKIDLVDLKKLAPEYGPTLHSAKKLLLESNPSLQLAKNASNGKNTFLKNIQ